MKKIRIPVIYFQTQNDLTYNTLPCRKEVEYKIYMLIRVHNWIEQYHFGKDLSVL